MVFVLDNYDSFTYNLVQYLGELGAEVEVRRNDQVTVTEVESMRPERILISPGPCTPTEAGISVELTRHLAGKVPILGVCLGHQAIGAAFGGEVVRAPKLMHGKTSEVQHDGKTIFRGLASPERRNRPAHNHGHAPSKIPRRRSAVSPRKRAHHRRQTVDPELFGRGRRIGGGTLYPPPLATSTARSTARALFMHSSNSRPASESATIPAPACR
jgi:anthranilate synthase/aminodeoxychorismate synthase-like glutamine amidotransferase